MVTSVSDEDFSIIKGGLMERALMFLRIVKPGDPKNAIRKIIFFIAITWVPLLIFTLASGLFWTDEVQIPFLYDFPVHTRFLLALPLLVLAEGIADKRIKLIINQFSKAGLLHEDGKAKFELAKARADRMVENPWAEAFFMVFIIANLGLRIWKHLPDPTTSTWQLQEIGKNVSISSGTWWFVTISMPIFQFIVFRWLWRWIIWLRLHFMISKSNLNLTPTHPDKAGGIGFLGEPPAPFGMVTLAFGLVISSIIGKSMIFNGEDIAGHYVTIGVFVCLCIVINIVPLLVYFGPLRLTRIRGIFEYSALIHKHHLQFTSKWFESNPNEELLIGNPDISSMCDFSPVYDSVEKMHLFPFDIKTMLTVVLTSIVPLLPLAALIMPIGDLLKVLVGLVL
jgi:hypothetical protein